MGWLKRLRCKLFGKSKIDERLESAQRRIHESMVRIIEEERKRERASRPDRHAEAQ